MDFVGEKIYKCGNSLSKIYKCGEVVWSKEIDYTKLPLTFEALESGTLVTPQAGDKHRINGGEWIDNSEAITVIAGDKVEFLGENSGGTRSGYFTFGDIEFNVYGNINSIIYGEDFPNHNNDAAKAFRFLFRYCKAVNAGNLILPAVVSNYCYQGMFGSCTSLTTAPELPATTLANYCYFSMFNNCTSLTTAPELPTTTLAPGCYRGMFTNCTSLTKAPELPVTTLAHSCYESMFAGCRSLTTAPELPATTLKDRCYAIMFEDCSSLTKAPELPATTIGSQSYYWMFHGCSSLTKAPELPATTLASQSYYSMFYGCASLNYIKCLATDISASECTDGWVTDVSPTGTFVKAARVEWPRGESGIPSGWTVIEE